MSSPLSAPVNRAILVDVAGNPVTRLPVDLGATTISLSGATLNTPTSPALSEILFVDTSTRQFVVRRSILNADGTITTEFVNMSGAVVIPTLANLGVPIGYNQGAATVTVATGGGTTEITLSQYTYW